MRSATTTTTTVLLLLLLLPGQFLLSAAAFSEESLKDLSRLPHFQRIWLQRLDQSNRRNSNNFSSSSSSAKVTTSSARPSSSSTATSTWTDPSTTDESLEEVVDGDERVTTVGPSAVGRNADAGMELTGGKVTLTISEAKERLKARRIKSRKVKTVMQQQKEEEEEQQLNNQGHYQYNKKTDNIFRDEKEEAVEVKKHIQRMASAGCSTPALRLIYVRQQHEAAPNVRYLPACTWLHRCSDETGCCTDDSKICSASHIESVSLPFFVLTMTGSETKRTVTRLSFENHTACECVGRNSDLMPRTEPYISDPVIRKSRLSTATTLLYNHDESNNSDEGKSSRHHENVSKSSKTKKGRRHDDRPPPPPPSSSLQLGRVATAYSPDPALLFHARNEQDEEEDSVGAKRRFGGPSPGSNYSNSSSSVSKCRCPSGFTPVASSRKRSACGLCQCHDYDFGRSRHHHGGFRAANPATARHHHHQNLCGRLKRGLETFSPRDRGCIVEKKCGTPECSYGRYVTLAGRCPRRHELRPRS